MGETRGVANLPNRLAYGVDGTPAGTVEQAWLKLYVNVPTEQGIALGVLAQDAGRLAAAVGMGAIPAQADAAIRAGRTAKGTHPGTGQAWSVERAALSETLALT